MRKFFYVLIVFVVMFSQVAGATTIKDVDLKNKLANILSDIKSISVSAATRIGALRQQGIDIIQTYSGDVDQDDKTAFQAINTKTTTAKDALDDLNAEIETLFPTVE